MFVVEYTWFGDTCVTFVIRGLDLHERASSYMLTRS